MRDILKLPSNVHSLCLLLTSVGPCAENVPNNLMQERDLEGVLALLLVPHEASVPSHTITSVLLHFYVNFYLKIKLHHCVKIA